MSTGPSLLHIKTKNLYEPLAQKGTEQLEPESPIADKTRYLREWTFIPQESETHNLCPVTGEKTLTRKTLTIKRNSRLSADKRLPESFFVRLGNQTISLRFLRARTLIFVLAGLAART